jgi:PIN domain nuclease of toxin-antitoxin system
MRLLLDSHVFVWAKSAPQILSDEARAAIIDPDNEAFVSIASAWELWLKHARKRVAGIAAVLDGGAQAFIDATKESGIALLGITLEHTAAAAKLPPVHRDPFDRMLIAQAIDQKLTIVTSDLVFKRYAGLRVLDA